MSTKLSSKLAVATLLGVLAAAPAGWAQEAHPAVPQAGSSPHAPGTTDQQGMMGMGNGMGQAGNGQMKAMMGQMTRMMANCNKMMESMNRAPNTPAKPSAPTPRG